MNSPVQSPLPDPIERTLVDSVVNIARSAVRSLVAGFVRCEKCGDQEATADMDFVPELDIAIAKLDHYRAAHAPKAEAAPLLDRLNYACNGACTCGTKTHEVRHHHLTCHFRLFTEAMERISPKPSVAAAFSPETPLEELTPDCRPPAEHEGEDEIYWLVTPAGLPSMHLWDAGEQGWRSYTWGPLKTPAKLGRLPWSVHSVARPSPDIDHITDAGKKIEGESGEPFKFPAAITETFDAIRNDIAIANASVAHAAAVYVKLRKISPAKTEQLDRAWAQVVIALDHRKSCLAAELTASVTTKPLPAQVQVEATEGAIIEFVREAMPGAMMATHGYVRLIRRALAHFRSPPMFITDAEIKEIGHRIGWFPDDVGPYMLVGAVLAHMNGKSA